MDAQQRHPLGRWKWPVLLGALTFPFVMAALGGLIARSAGGAVPVGVVMGLVATVFLIVCAYIVAGAIGSRRDS